MFMRFCILPNIEEKVKKQYKNWKRFNKMD